MYTLKIFADVRKYPTAVLALIEALPVLKDHGYDTLYLESPWENADIDKVISLTSHKVRTILLFSSTNGVVPKNKTNEQKEFINEMLLHYGSYSTLVSDVKKVYDEEKDFLETLQQRIEMLKLLKQLGMRLVNIDVKRPSEYTNPNSLIKRNRYMLDCIKKNTGESKKGVVFVGIAHAIDVWDRGQFNLGVLSLMSQDKEFFDVEKSKIYHVCSYKENAEDRKREIDVPLAICGDTVLNRTQIIDISKGEKFLDELIKDLKSEASNQPFFKIMGNSEKSLYFIPKDSDQQNIHYVASLGGVLKKPPSEKLEYELEGYFYEMPVSSLTKERRNFLGVDRVSVSELSDEEASCLKEVIKTLTIDTVTTPKPEFYLTFFDDRNVKVPFHMKNRDCIINVGTLIKYGTVIKQLDQIDKQIMWKIFIDSSKIPLATVKGFFKNQNDAEVTLNQVKKTGFESAHLEEYKGDWSILISNLDNYLQHKITPLPVPFKSSLFPSSPVAQGNTSNTATAMSIPEQENPNSSLGNKGEIKEENNDEHFASPQI